MKRHLDSVDERILEELARNARLSHNDIAQKVYLSRNAVRLRIERMERDGHIRGYTIVRGATSEGQAKIKALIFVYRTDRMRGADVLKAIAAIPEVVAWNVMSGDLDIVLNVVAGDSDRIHHIWTDISTLSGVANTVTSFVLSSCK